LELPQAVAPVANYVPFVVSGKLVFVSGQVPLVDGKPQFVGRLGDTLSVEEGYQAPVVAG
jgi:enamine deaminase RidA (YjgF/YER057c/UK114 family)